MGEAHPESPFFSVIVLNWNGRHLLEECLRTVLAQDFRDFEVVVVDNGSTDGSAEWMKERWAGQVRVVELPENRGFAGGNNAGIRISSGKFVVLLNNDTEADSGWLAALAAAIGRHPGAGMFTPKILNYYRRDEIDNTGLVIYPDGLARGRHRLEKDDGRFDEEGEALVPSGCAGVYRKEMLDQVGLLDESFFAYGEDVDLGLRARWAGWSCYYVPDARVYHKYSATAGAYSPQKAFLVERNRLWILFRNFPFREICLSPLYTGWRYLLHLRGIFGKRGASYRFSRDYPARTLVWIVLRAEISAFFRILYVLRGRRDMKGNKALDNSAFRELIKRFLMTGKDVALLD